MKLDAGQIAGELVREPSVDEMCARCGNILRVLRILRGDSRGTGRVITRLCATCLAEGLDIATGYNVTNQINHWDAFSAVAAELADASHRSRKARKKQAERESARAARQERVL